MARKPVNLTLSKETVRMGNRLKKPLRQRSMSGVVEVLVGDAAVKMGLVKDPVKEAA